MKMSLDPRKRHPEWWAEFYKEFREIKFHRDWRPDRCIAETFERIFKYDAQNRFLGTEDVPLQPA